MQPPADRVCPSDDVLSAMANGQLSPQELGEADGHLDTCDDCRQLLAELVLLRSHLPIPPATLAPTDTGLTLAAEDDGPWERGSSVGRYLLLEALGRGAMGVVYAAYDPLLDRRVALKFLRGPQGVLRMESRERLLREARALGRLNHPNVVTVHEVGSDEQRSFIAMELVEGGTLASWRRRQNPSWAETLRMYREAGEGLAAAHRAGLVHRDFKPQNVLVGTDGVPRVADFGLVRGSESGEALGTSPAPSPTPPWSLRAGEQTQPGMLVGTPLYMAPEQRQGETATARSDQYAFCVALWEALFQAHPDAVAAAGSAPTLPRPIRAALQRGLSVAPADRFETMEALLTQLRPPAQRTWLRWAALALVVVSSLAAIPWAVERQRIKDCEAADPALANVWSPATQARLAARFASTGAPFAADSFRRVRTLLDGYAESWSTLRTQSCLAYRVRKEEPATVHRLRASCLDEKRAELSALLAVLAEPNLQVVEGSIHAALSLTPPAECASTEALLANASARTSGDSGAERELRATLEQSWALQRAFQPQRALTLLQRALPRVRTQGDARLLTEALTLEGTLRSALTDAGAPDVLQEAVFVAQGARMEPWAFRAALELARNLTYNHPADASLWTRYASATAQHLPTTLATSVELQMQEARLARTREDEASATAHLTAARTALEQSRSSAPSKTLELLELEASTAQHFGKDAEGTRSRERVLELAERTYGPGHPETARALMELAPSLSPERKAGLLRRALPILEQTYGEENLQVAVALDRLGQALLAQKQPTEALPFSLRAEHTLAALAPSEASHALALGNLADVQLALGDDVGAARALEDDATIMEKLFGPGNYRLSKPLERQARLALRHHRPREAEQLARAALTAWEKGPRRTRWGLLSQLDLDLAEALWTTPARRPAAQALAQSAATEAERAQEPELEALARQWLRLHPR